jgi:hypothetical protein
MCRGGNCSEKPCHKEDPAGSYDSHLNEANESQYIVQINMYEYCRNKYNINFIK